MAVLVLSSKSQGSQRFSTEFGNALLSHAFYCSWKAPKNHETHKVWELSLLIISDYVFSDAPGKVLIWDIFHIGDSSDGW